MTYYISCIDKTGQHHRMPLDLYDNEQTRIIFEIEKVLFIEDVPTSVENIRSINLAICNIEKLLCQHLEIKINRR